MNLDIQIQHYSQDNYSSFRNLVKQLQLFEAEINQYRSIDDSKIDQIAQEIIETNQEKNGQLLLSQTNNEVVGCISYYLDDDVLNSKKHVYVSDLIVSEEYRGNGIAKRLMMKAEEYAQSLGVTTVRVAVLAQSSSKEFYHKLGFEDETVELVKEV